MTWNPSGIKYSEAIAEFRTFTSAELTEPEYVSRLETCRDCSLCRVGKCLPTGQCVHRKARAAAETCVKGKWPALDFA